MKVLIQVALCSALFLGVSAAQHRGGGGGGGGSRGSIGGGGGARIGGGGSISRGGIGGGIGSYGYRGGVGSYGYRGGIGSYGYRGGYGYGYRGFYGGYGYPYYGYGFGLGYGLGWPYYGYYGGYYDYPYSYYPDTSYYYSQPAYQPAYQSTQDVNVIYPPSQPAAPTYANPSAPASRGYDQYGQQLQPSGGAYASSSPIYLIALKNHNIIAASSYSVNGGTLQYVTLDHAANQVTLDELDRDLTQRLNRERHVPFQLPQQ